MRLSTLLFFAYAISSAYGGNGPGDGPGGSKESISLALNSKVLTVTSSPSSTMQDSPSSTAPSAGSPTNADADKKGESGGEGTTPIDAFVLTPLYLVAGLTLVFVIGRVLVHRLRENHRYRGKHHHILQNPRPLALWSRWLRFRYAPLFAKRHSREFRPFKWLRLGVIPTRLEVHLMIVYFMMNITFIVASIDWSGNEMGLKMYGLRNHSGTLATANLIPLVLTASRNNPLIPLLRISFNTFNTMHRYLGRLIVVETLLHVSAVLGAKVPTSGWSVAPQELWGKELVLYGFISSIMFIAIVTQAWAPFRHAFYETFLHIHVLLSIGAFITLWYHLETLQHQYMMIGVFVAWAIERIARVALIAWWNINKQFTRITVELLPNDLTRLTITVARAWKVLPGQHLYLYIPSIGLWTSHPFSIAWVEKSEERLLEGVTEDTDISAGLESQVVFLLAKAENGLSKSLVKKATRSPNGTFSTLAFVEGPYGGLESPSSFDSVVLIAGGVGVTHQLLYIRDLITSYQYGESPVRRIILAWAIRAESQLEWIQPWLRQLLAQHAQVVRREAPLQVRILIHISPTEKYIATRSREEVYRARNHTHSAQPSASSNVSATPILNNGVRNVMAMDSIPLAGEHETASVELFHNRLNSYSLIDKEVQGSVEAIYVGVCGPGGLADDVRDAVRRHLKRTEKVIEFYEEAFSW